MFSKSAAFSFLFLIFEASSPAASEVVNLKSDFIPPARALEELISKFPEDGWKLVGFSESKGKSLLTLKVPKFLHWDDGCVQNTKGGVEYCSPGEGESTPSLRGEAAFGGKTRIFKIGIEVNRTAPPFKFLPLPIPAYDAKWGSIGALVSKGWTKIAGYDAFNVEVEQKDSVEKSPIFVVSLYNFSLTYLRGSIFFEEVEDRSGKVVFVSREARVFSSFIQGIVSSVNFSVKVEDAPAKLVSKDKLLNSLNSCKPSNDLDIKNCAARNEVVFFGKVISSKKSGSMWPDFDYVAEVDAYEVLKGEVQKRYSINYLSYGKKSDGRIIDSCSKDPDGAEFIVGSEVLVFAEKIPSGLFTDNRNGGGSIVVSQHGSDPKIQEVKRVLGKIPHK